MDKKIIGIIIGILILGIVAFESNILPDSSISLLKSPDAKVFFKGSKSDLSSVQDNSYCSNLDLMSRNGATLCFQDLIKKGYFERFENPTGDDAISKLVSLGATQSSAEWAVYDNFNFLFIPYSTSIQGNEIMDTYVDTECWDEQGCETCHTTYDDGGVLLSTVCVNMDLCEVQAQFIYMNGDYIYSEFYDYMVSDC